MNTLERFESEDPNSVLLVLYLNGTKQTYCIYSGGHEEADGELSIIKSNEPSRIEVGRIWVNEHTTYSRCIV